MRSEKLTAEKNYTQKHLQCVSESLRLVFNSIWVHADCGMLNNSEFDFCRTVFECANRLWLF